MSIFSLVLISVIPAAAPLEDPSHPLQLDRTGIRWIVPFEQARAAAESAKRLLLIKPVAFGTDKAGGW